MLNALTNVRFWGQSGHGADLSVCPLMTQSGHQLAVASHGTFDSSRLAQEQRTQLEHRAQSLDASLVG
jgi:hypothetical protein